MNLKFAKRRSDREGVDLPFESEKPTTDYDQHVHQVVQEKSESIPELGNIELLEQYYNKYKNDPHYLITYANNPVVATNYKSYSSGRYQTPPGYYAYPVKELGDHTARFAKNYKYIILTRITTDKILNLGDYSEQDFENDIERLKSLVDPEIVEKCIAGNIQYTIHNISQKLGNVFKQSVLYLKLGYNIVIDPGLGIIHQHEPRQTVVFTPHSDLELIGIFGGVTTIKEIEEIKKFNQEASEDSKINLVVENPSFF
jgi:hypothetical protein